MAYSGMNPAQRERLGIWQEISSSCIKAQAESAGLASPKVMHVVGPSDDPAKRDLVLIFQGLDLKTQEGLQSILGPDGWESPETLESLLGWEDKAEGLQSILGPDIADSPEPAPADEFTVQVKWKAHRTNFVADGTLRVSWPGAYMVFPVMIRDQFDD